jgi:VanZ family protein
MPLIQLMRATIASTEVGATIGHVGLFAILTAVGCLGVARWLPGLHGLLVVMLLALLLSTATELYQLVLADRDASLADLLANWLGVFVVGFGIAARRLASKQRRRHPTTA